ncbi:hypothetical protein [Aureimonas sp. SK2]|uniref:hypothetical protein n=1 Tax=Aureimonas sp. SK2 TaxID=3015992 RepID=UPI002444DED9|nr:hypothetical protein [Aureimonas sp. SK2]
MSATAGAEEAERDENLKDRAFRFRVFRIRDRASGVLDVVRQYAEWADHAPYPSVGTSQIGEEVMVLFADCSRKASQILRQETTQDNGVPGGWAERLPRLGEVVQALGNRTLEAAEALEDLLRYVADTGEADRDELYQSIGDVDFRLKVQLSPALLSDALWCARVDREREREEAGNSSAYRMQRSRKRRAAGYQSYRAELHSEDLRALRSVGLLVGDLDDKDAVEVALDSLIRTAIACIPVQGEREELRTRLQANVGAAHRTSMLYRLMVERMNGLIEMEKPS